MNFEQHAQCSHTKTKREPTPRAGSLFVVRTTGFDLHFRIAKIEDPLRQAAAGNAHPRCI